MEIKIGKLLGAGDILAISRNRGNLPTNYAISMNLKRLEMALEPFRRAQKEVPLKYRFGAPSDSESNDDGSPKPATQSEYDAGHKSFGEWLEMDVCFEPYKIRVSKLCDSLVMLSDAEEAALEKQTMRKMDERLLQTLNQEFSMVCDFLDIISTDEEFPI